jgi:PAS domain S-box-containing protein
MGEPSEGVGTWRAPAPEREIFRRLFEASPLAILIADDEGTYLEANATACALFGCSHDVLVGKRVYDFVDPTHLTPVQNQWTDFREQRRQSGEFPLLRPDGSRRILRYHAVAEVVPGLHVSFLEDVSALRRAESLQSAAEEQRELMFDLSPDIIAVIDAERRFRRVNAALSRVLGYPAGEVLGRDYLELAHPDDVSALLAARRQVDEHGSVRAHPARFRDRTGVYRWISWSSTEVGGEHFVVGRDVTAEHETRAALEASERQLRTVAEEQRQSIERLQQERELRERFVAALSHDLRSPLTAAKLGAEIILRRIERREVCQTQATRILRNIDQADQLIHNLLDASRISAGESVAVHRAPCDVLELVQEVLADQTTVHGDRFLLEAPPVLRGCCDRTAIRRILENLLGNAIKYGAPRTPVRVILDQRDGEISLAIHNEGTPIPPDELPRIFQPFHRARPQSSDGPRGWGLGLTLVRGTAEAHGGTVRVESAPGVGTTFTVTLRND